MGYERADLQKKMSDNLNTLEQLRYFERVMHTRCRVAQANTYDTEEYRTIVLSAYEDYLSSVKINIDLRVSYDQILQTLVREAAH